MNPPTTRQLEVLQAAADFIATHDYPPTYRELCAVTETHFLDVYEKLERLERNGCVELTRRTGRRGPSRNMHITDRGYKLLGLPAHRPIVPRMAGFLPADGTVDLGSRCPECGVQLFGGLTHCAEHRSAA